MGIPTNIHPHVRSARSVRTFGPHFGGSTVQLQYWYWKSPCSMGKSTISMAIFNSYMLVITRGYWILVTIFSNTRIDYHRLSWSGKTMQNWALRPQEVPGSEHRSIYMPIPFTKKWQAPDFYDISVPVAHLWLSCGKTWATVFSWMSHIVKWPFDPKWRWTKTMFCWGSSEMATEIIWNLHQTHNNPSFKPSSALRFAAHSVPPQPHRRCEHTEAHRTRSPRMALHLQRGRPYAGLDVSAKMHDAFWVCRNMYDICICIYIYMSLHVYIYIHLDKS